MADRLQVAEGKLEAEGEEQQGDADLRQQSDVVDLRDRDPAGVGADQDAGEEYSRGVRGCLSLWAMRPPSRAATTMMAMSAAIPMFTSRIGW